MPQQLTYPGVYVEEIPSGVRTIIGVSTSITAFIGRAKQGPVNEPVRIQSFGDYERVFGGLWVDSTMSYAVRQYFINGGSDAIIVRVFKADSDNATLENALYRVATDDEDATPPLLLRAANPGAWANSFLIDVDYDTSDSEDTDLFNLTITNKVGDTVLATERFYNLTLASSTSPRYAPKVLENQSALVRVPAHTVGTPIPAVRPLRTLSSPVAIESVDQGHDGVLLTDTEYRGDGALKTGIYALDKADIFNILCIPPRVQIGATSGSPDFSSNVWADALAYVKKRRAMLIVNAPAGTSGWDAIADVTDADTGIDSITRDENATLYFPNVMAPDPLRENMLEQYAPCGVAAGVMARTDATRGVWKAPAGIDATLIGVQALSIKMTDGENGQLNPLGVNCLRTLPAAGNVIWGARTLKGADRLASEWKYLPVRRLALYLEESLYRGSQWAVFEPNDEPLWAQLRTNIGAFMHQLYRQGAFQGRSPREAYFVKCDKETTTQNDINQGIVNVLIGFAPLKPAEFVVLKIQQIAGQIES
jgi:phage tail sheath protein FI